MTGRKNDKEGRNDRRNKEERKWDEHLIYIKDLRYVYFRVKVGEWRTTNRFLFYLPTTR